MVRHQFLNMRGANVVATAVSRLSKPLGPLCEVLQTPRSQLRSSLLSVFGTTLIEQCYYIGIAAYKCRSYWFFF